MIKTEICVFGASSKTIDEKYIKSVEDMGEFLAKRGHNLVFGSGSTGSMGAAARGFKRGGGKTHGVVPRFFNDGLAEFVDYNCDEMTFTDTMRERKGIMEELSQSFVVTPGGAGTFEEFFEVLTLKQLGRHQKPIAIYNIDGYYDMLLASIDDSVQKKFIRPSVRLLFKAFTDLEEMADYLENDDISSLTLSDLK